MSVKTYIGQACFWLGIIIELIIVIIDKSAYIDPLEGQLFRLTFVLFCVKILTTKYTKNEWLFILGLGIIMMISYLINTRDEAVRVVALIAACKDISLPKSMKVVFYVTLAGCLAVAFLSITGIYGDVSVVADYGRNGVEERYTLGMGHPNALHCMVLMLLILYMYIYFESMKIYQYIICFLINIGIYILTDSNTGFIIGVLGVMSALMMRYGKKLRDSKWIYWLVAGVIVLCVVFSILGAAFGDSVSGLYEIDDLINGRYKSAFMVEDARLCNWKIFSAPDMGEYFDAGYIRLVYWYGIIPAALYIAMNMYLLYQSYKSKDYMLAVMILVFSVYMIMEAHLISVYLLRNYLFIMMGYYWYQPLEGGIGDGYDDKRYSV